MKDVRSQGKSIKYGTEGEAGCFRNKSDEKLARDVSARGDAIIKYLLLFLYGQRFRV